jgi:hypothetical protein
MASERKLPLGREDANAIIRTGGPGLEKKDRLAKVGPIGEGCHLRIGQRICSDNDSQRIAAQWARCEHVDLLKREAGHVAAPLS